MDEGDGPRVDGSGDLLPEMFRPHAAALGDHLTLVRAADGQTVAHQGEKADALFVLARGRATVLRRLASGQELMLGTLGPGDFFGEIGLLSGRPRTASVVASEPSIAWRLDQDGFLKLLEMSPSIAKGLQARAVERMRVQAHQAQELLRQVLEILAHLRQLETSTKLTEAGYSLGIALGDAESGVSRVGSLMAELESLVEILDRDSGSVPR